MSHFGTNQRGFILVITLILTSITLVLTTAFALLVQTDVKLRGGAVRAQAGFYAAEAGLNIRMAELFTIFDSYGVPQGTVFDEMSIGFNGRTVYTQVETVAGSCSDTGNVNCFVTIPAGEKFAGLRTLPYRYAITSTAVNAQGDAEAEVGAEVVIHNIPVFQFLVFYALDL